MSWKYAYASVMGTSHQYSGTACQDASKVSTFISSNGEKILIAVAADGAGSASHSELGSKLVTRIASKCVQKWLEKDPSLEDITPEVVAIWVKTIKKRLEVNVEKHNVPGIRQLASTFLLAVIGENTSVFAQIGDGAIVIANDSTYECVFWPQNGEYINTTCFITDEKALENLQIDIRNYSVNELSVFTDGIQMLALSYKDQTPHQPFFEPMFAYLRSQNEDITYQLIAPLKAFLVSERVNDRTDDDKTLILATKQ